MKPPPPLDLSTFTEVPFPVATVAELRRNGMMRVEGMGRALLLVWNDGSPRVFDDACAHLGYPMTQGRLEGDRVRCPYHGWAFGLDDGRILEQPTLHKIRPCSLVRHGALMAGDLVFAWIGDPDATETVRAKLPEQVLEGISLHRVVFDCPFYMALFSSIDYSHFSRHEGYSTFYSLYRRIRGNTHLPGSPFHSRIADEDDHSICIRIDEAGRDLRMYATATEFKDDGGVNHFQTYVTPLGPTKTLYWECFRPRSENALVRWSARLAFRTIIVRLLDGEDRDWTADTAPPFLAGDNIHLCENDLPLIAHLRKFVLPRSA